MQPAAWPEPDPQIAAAIKAMYGSRKMERPLAVEIRDRLGQWLADEDFAVAFGIRGRPGWPPSRLALVTVLQRAHGAQQDLAAASRRSLPAALAPPTSGLAAQPHPDPPAG